VAPINPFMHLFSAVPTTLFIDRSRFSEPRMLEDE
jgi:aspartyl/asparaginyl beta-hydroxylase (cupin superfamily)